jgi:hypothetical protein
MMLADAESWGATMDPHYDSPGTLLRLLMRRRGWSAVRLAEASRGGACASSIRAYASDRSSPRLPQALALAQAMGHADGRALLEAWGYPDVAEGFGSPPSPPLVGEDPGLRARAGAPQRRNLVEYPGEPLSAAGLDIIRSVAAWIQQMEATPRRPLVP